MFINGEFVDDGLVRIEAARVRGELRSQIDVTDELALEMQAREAGREIVIERTVLRQAALKDPTPIPPEFIEAELQQYRQQAPEQAACQLPRDWETLRANIETELRIRRFVAQLTRGVPEPTNKDVLTFYKYAKDSLALPETIHAAHIVKNIDDFNSEAVARAAIEQILSLLQQGLPFETVADEYSDCPGRGGDLGFFARGEMVDEFDNFVFSLPVDAISPIFRTVFGFHIAKVYEHRPPRTPSLNEVRSQLVESIRRQRRVEAARAYTKQLRAQAEIRRSK